MAQVDYFLKIDTVKGESEDKAHKGEIDVLSWSWGETNSGSMAHGGGGGSGKVSMQDFHFTMRNGLSSPELMLACAEGRHIKEAVLTCRKAGTEQQEYLTMKFSDLLISSFQTGGSSGDIVPVDQVSFNYSKIQYEYKAQDEKGKVASPVKAGWDLKKNVKV